jgi:hypothetical protein
MRYLVALMLVFGMAQFSFAGNCANGICKKPSVVKPVRPKSIVRPFSGVRK